MKKKRRRLSGSGVVFLVFSVGLLVFFCTFGLQMIREFSEGKKPYQSVVSLDGPEWGEDLTEELKRIPGLSSLTPAVEIPVRLRVETYTMDAAFIGVELEELEKRVSRSREVPLGNTPVLLFGEGSLAAMTDQNGHAASEEKQKELLERYGERNWEYCLAGDGEEAESWKPCLVAAVLSSPADGIYMAYSQAELLAGKKETDRFLLTVLGKGNYERALGLFQESSF